MRDIREALAMSKQLRMYDEAYCVGSLYGTEVFMGRLDPDRADVIFSDALAGLKITGAQRLRCVRAYNAGFAIATDALKADYDA